MDARVHLTTVSLRLPCAPRSSTLFPNNQDTYNELLSPAEVFPYAEGGQS